MEISTMFNFGDIVKFISTAADKRGQEYVGEIVRVIVMPRYVDRSLRNNVSYEIRLNDGNTVYANDPYYYDYTNEADNGEILKIVAHYTPANGCYGETGLYAENGIIKEEVITECGNPCLNGGRLLR